MALVFINVYLAPQCTKLRPRTPIGQAVMFSPLPPAMIGQREVWAPTSILPVLSSQHNNTALCFQRISHRGVFTSHRLGPLRMWDAVGGRTCSTGARLEHTIRAGGGTDAKPVTRQVRIFKVLDLVQRICFCFPYVLEVARFLVHIKKKNFTEMRRKRRSNCSVRTMRRSAPTPHRI